MKADELAKGIEGISNALSQTSDFLHTVLKDTADELRRSWVVNQLDCATYLSDDEFEQLQGLIKKVEVLREKDGKRKDEKTP